MCIDISSSCVEMFAAVYRYLEHVCSYVGMLAAA